VKEEINRRNDFYEWFRDLILNIKSRFTMECHQDVEFIN